MSFIFVNNPLYITMKILSFLTTFLLLQNVLFGVEMLQPAEPNKLVKSTKRIYIEGFYGAHNPSIVKFNDGYLMSFRWSPNRLNESWISYICLVLLNSSFEPISTVDILNTRCNNDLTPSQSEDGRIFYYNDKLYVVYNDNMELIFPSYWERRDMYIAEIVWDENNKFTLLEPMLLRHETKYREKPWQKNWNPFVWNDQLCLSYNLHPHEVILANLDNGICKPFFEAKVKDLDWKYGALRGATPAEMVDGEYLAFFHSGIYERTACSEYQEMWHYYIGAYTYSSLPPFALTKMSKEPIEATEFYTSSSYSKRVVYPGGFIIDGPNLYLAYGKDDYEIWIATLDLAELKNSLMEIK